MTKIVENLMTTTQLDEVVDNERNHFQFHIEPSLFLHYSKLTASVLRKKFVVKKFSPKLSLRLDQRFGNSFLPLVSINMDNLDSHWNFLEPTITQFDGNLLLKYKL